jgi:exodeoxyribonuclease VII small subunit
MASNKTPDPRPEFERSLEELETLVERMERGELSLEESLAQFERGIELTRNCQRALADAEQRIEVLMDRAGTRDLEAFGEGPDESEDDGDDGDA